MYGTFLYFIAYSGGGDCQMHWILCFAFIADVGTSMHSGRQWNFQMSCIVCAFPCTYQFHIGSGWHVHHSCCSPVSPFAGVYSPFIYSIRFLIATFSRAQAHEYDIMTNCSSVMLHAPLLFSSTLGLILHQKQTRIADISIYATRVFLSVPCLQYCFNILNTSNFTSEALI